MYDFRNRPKDNYIHHANWKQLFILTEYWKSDLLFYQDDLKFLHHLIDKYFLLISKKDNVDKVLEIEVNLLNVDKQCASLLKKTNKHLQYLAELIDNPFAYDAHKFKIEHEILEDSLAQFVKDFRNNRKEVFRITEYIMDHEQLVHQLNTVNK
ncbi:hypothetical protein EGM88_15295 [Aureibaculum marinum]|uniref:Uncharacterized protein n=1 Tax=Aureibaculum marinum TaxID=2487930 RepID=A0A3N4NH08_9FLAO|nr:hypothetical protein [Aureibaculum marinum]RPD90779.1 hypothetical protein EGM88_15295 [Aureibaculum marinum]